MSHFPVTPFLVLTSLNESPFIEQISLLITKANCPAPMVTYLLQLLHYSIY